MVAKVWFLFKYFYCRNARKQNFNRNSTGILQPQDVSYFLLEIKAEFFESHYKNVRSQKRILATIEIKGFRLFPGAMHRVLNVFAARFVILSSAMVDYSL